MEAAPVMSREAMEARLLRPMGGGTPHPNLASAALACAPLRLNSASSEGRVIVPDSMPNRAPPQTPRPGSAPKGGRPADTPPRPGSAPKGGRPADAVAVVLDALSKTDVEKEKLSTGAVDENFLKAEAQRVLEERHFKKIESELKKDAAKKEEGKETCPDKVGSDNSEDSGPALDNQSTGKKSKPPSDSTENPNKFLRCMEKCKTLLKSKGLNTDLVLNVTDIEEIEAEVELAKKTFEQFELIHVASKKIKSATVEPELMQKDVVPFHIIGLSLLLYGKKEEPDFIEVICKLWKENVDFVVSLTKKNASEILKRVMCKHVKETSKMYYILLSASDYPGLCKQRGNALISWVKRVKTEAAICWNHEKPKIMLRIVRKANTYMPDEAMAEEQQQREEEKWTAGK